MNDLVSVFKGVGIGLGILIVFAYILNTQIIPYYKARGEREQAFKHKQADRIADREDGILKDISSFIQQNIAESKAMSGRMDALTEEIRTENRERRRK